MIVVDRLIDIGERLRLDALAGIDHQQRALARRQRPAHLIGKVDMAGRVDEIEDIVLAILGLVIEADRLRLDGDAALALDVHRIEHLRAHLALAEAAGRLNQPIGKRRLAVVDMGDDGEVADMIDGNRCHRVAVALAPQSGKEPRRIRAPMPQHSRFFNVVALCSDAQRERRRENDMRIALPLIAMISCLALSACVVHPVRGCINRPVVCAGTVAAGVAGGYWLVNNTDLGNFVPTP